MWILLFLFTLTAKVPSRFFLCGSFSFFVLLLLSFFRFRPEDRNKTKMSGGNELRYFEDSMGRAQVRKLLDNKTGSRGDSEKISGMKWLLADISKGAFFFVLFVLRLFHFRASGPRSAFHCADDFLIVCLIDCSRACGGDFMWR